MTGFPYLHPVLIAYLALLGVTVFWGFTFPIVQWSLDDCSPVLFVALRFALAALIFPLIFGRKSLSLDSRFVWRGLVLGAFLCGGYIFQTIGLRYTTSARAGFITALYVPLTPILAWMFLKAKIRKRMWLAALIAFAGIVVLSVPETFAANESLWSQLSLNLGDQLILGCAICYALHILFVNRWSTKESELPLTWLQLAGTGVIAAALLPVDQFHITLTKELIVALLFTSTLASVVAIWAMMRYQPRLPVTGAAIIYSMEPVMAGLAAWTMQNQIPPPITLLGAAMIMSAMIIASTIHEPELPAA
ncbi:MAG: DMT family transporter [Calditrichaeota bacterium]|nr:DMT family transporter [Calditrichota bacterium]